MNGYNKSNNKKILSSLSIVLGILLIFEICSLTVLFDRLTRYVPAESSNIFPLTKSDGRTSVKYGTLTKDGNIFYNDEVKFNSTLAPTYEIEFLGAIANDISVVALADENDASGNSAVEGFQGPQFDLSGDTDVWEGNTLVELFKCEYENEDGEITVSGDGVSKLIAPGTSNSYTFTLKNTGSVSLDYEMQMRAYVTINMDVSLPIVVRLVDHDGEYLVGATDGWADVMELNNVEKKGVLASDRYANYTLEWMWPFEGDDTLDTYLGDLSGGADVDITLTIEINTYAIQSSDPNDPGDNPPQTGDNTLITVIIAIISLVVAVGIAYYGKQHFGRNQSYEY